MTPRQRADLEHLVRIRGYGDRHRAASEVLHRDVREVRDLSEHDASTVITGLRQQGKAAAMTNGTNGTRPTMTGDPDRDWAVLLSGFAGVGYLVGSTAAAVGFGIFAGLMWLMWIGEWAGWW